MLYLSQTVISPPAINKSQTKSQETRDQEPTHPQPTPQPAAPPSSSIHPTAPSIPAPLFVADFSQRKYGKGEHPQSQTFNGDTLDPIRRSHWLLPSSRKRSGHRSPKLRRTPNRFSGPDDKTIGNLVMIAARVLRPSRVSTKPSQAILQDVLRRTFSVYIHKFSQGSTPTRRFVSTWG